MRAPRLPAANCRAAVMMSWSGPARGRDEERGQGGGDEEGEEQGEHHGPAEVAHLLLDAGQGQGHADDADGSSRVAHRHRGVEQVVLHRGALCRVAVPTPEASASNTSGLEPWFSTAARAGPESEESASTRPSGATTVTRARTSRAACVHQGVELVGGDAPSEGLLDHAGHEPRLGQEHVAHARRGLAPRAPDPRRGAGSRGRKRSRPGPPPPSASAARASGLVLRDEPVAQRLHRDDALRRARAASRAGAARARPPCACPRRRSSPTRPRAGSGGRARGPSPRAGPRAGRTPWP